MRLFAAIDLHDEVKGLLADCIGSLRRQSVSGRFCDPDTLHLTLAFIGETDQVKAAKKAVGLAAAGPFELRVGGAGRFGDLWWAGVEKSPELSSLALRLAEALRSGGFPIPEREFRPHITLARQVAANGRVSLDVPSAAMTVDRISLMRSDRANGRPVYTEIHKVLL